jgi:hypothetical protein
MIFKMALLDIYKMKHGTVLDDTTKDMNILYEDGNGKKIKLSQIKEARPMVEQSVFSLMNNIAKMKNDGTKGYFITGHRVEVTRSFENIKYISTNTVGDEYERNIDLRHIKEVHVNEEEDDTNGKLIEHKVYNTRVTDGKYSLLSTHCDETITFDKDYDYTLSKGERTIKKRKIVEVPLMDDDIEMVLNRTREENYKILENLMDNEVEITSKEVPIDIYRIMSNSNAVLQNRNKDVFILDLDGVVKPISSGSIGEFPKGC